MLATDLWSIANKVEKNMQIKFLANNGNFMVPFALDTARFSLIYRHLQNIYWFKRGITTSKYIGTICMNMYLQRMARSNISFR